MKGVPRQTSSGPGRPPAWFVLSKYVDGTQSWSKHEWITAVRQRVFWSIYNPRGGLEQIKNNPLVINAREDHVPPVHHLTYNDVIEPAQPELLDHIAALRHQLQGLKGLEFHGVKEEARTKTRALRYPARFGFAYLAIDTRAPVRDLKAGFAAWIKLTRQNFAPTGKLDPAKWHKNRVLAFADLILWQRVETQDISDAKIAEWLAPATGDSKLGEPVDWLRKTVRPLYDAAFRSNPIWR